MGRKEGKQTVASLGACPSISKKGVKQSGFSKMAKP
jgi:hypothetical protein